MPFSAKWLTHKGAITDDNRDYCGVALRHGQALYVVVDGATKGDQSGLLAEAFVSALADRFITEPWPGNAEDIIAFLSDLSDQLKTLYFAGSLSFLILLDLGDSSVYALHAGGCRLGRIGKDNRITWISRPHTLANAVEELADEELSSHVHRHVLTRSFRPGKIVEIKVECHSRLENERLIIATDGYWADLDDAQKLGLINKSFVPTASQRDDVSCLLLSHLPIGSEKAALLQDDENFYLVTV